MPHKSNACRVTAMVSAVVVLALVGHPVLSQEREAPTTGED